MAIPSFVNLCQIGTVAGGVITVIFEIDDADRWSSGGTSESVFPLRSDNPQGQKCTLYSGATATDAAGGFLMHALLGFDVAPAEAARTYENWSIRRGTLPVSHLVGPAAFLIYTSATTTGPTWGWSIGWFEIPGSDVP